VLSKGLGMLPLIISREYVAPIARAMIACFVCFRTYVGAWGFLRDKDWRNRAIIKIYLRVLTNFKNGIK
jgi:hypothetical protein